MYLAIVIIVVMAAIGLFLFRYMEQKRKQRMIDQHERKRAQFEELLKMISDKKDEPCLTASCRQGSVTTKGEKRTET